jgi:two-component system, NarL family, response regulator NreC
MSIRVVVADDHPVVRDGLRLTFERSEKNIEIVGEAADGLEVLKLARTRPVDVFILDITMPNLNGIETTRELLRLFPAARVVILSLYGAKAMLEEALAAGARGFLNKEVATRHVVDAVTEVHAGRRYLCPLAIELLIETGHPAGAGGRKRGIPNTTLTRQERKVLQLIAEGYSNKEIAIKFGISEQTVHVHRTNLMTKLNLHKQADLIRYAIKAGIAKL